MSYGANEAETYRLLGIYTGKILKGEKPGDLPIQRTTQVELIINLKTAKALGISMPVLLAGRADCSVSPCLERRERPLARYRVMYLRLIPPILRYDFSSWRFHERNSGSKFG